MPINRDSAVQAVFQAMRSHARADLESLRDGPNDRAAAIEWANARGLGSPVIIDYACSLRDWWEKNINAKSDLRGGWVVYFEGRWRKNSPEEDQWVEANSRPENANWYLPDPGSQTLSCWLKDATKLYREREALIDPKHRARAKREHNNLDIHCGWFVEVHVNGIRPSVLAKQIRVEPPAIDEATKKVADLLGLRRRTWRRGRPTQY
ncbi:MAG: hypothetical protein H0W53_03920 [Acidobacteria bacterium]|nr:hypothetical protein [Acidobacteriota bacterium]